MLPRKTAISVQLPLTGDSSGSMK